MRGKDIQYCTYIGNKEVKIASVDIGKMYNKFDCEE